MRSHDWLRKYLEYIKIFRPNASAVKTKEILLRFAFGYHEGRESEMGTSMPIWANGAFEPVRVRLIQGKAELLSGMDIIKKLDLAGNFGAINPMLGRVDGER